MKVDTVQVRDTVMPKYVRMEDEICLQREIKRRRNFYIFILQVILHGVEFGIVESGLWAFMIGDGALSYSNMFYNAASLLSPFLLCIPVVNFVVRKNNPRSSLILINIFILFGTCCFIVPSIPAFPIIGRFLHALNFIVRVIIINEVSREYSTNDVSQRIASLLLGFNSGYLIGCTAKEIFPTISWMGNFHNNYPHVTYIVFMLFNVVQIVALTKHAPNSAIDNPNEFSADTEKEIIETEIFTTTQKADHDYSFSMKFSYEAIVLIVMSFQNGFGSSLLVQALRLIIPELGIMNTVIDFYCIGDALIHMALLTFVVIMKVSSGGMYFYCVCSIVCCFATNIFIIFVSNAGPLKLLMLAFSGILYSCYSTMLQLSVITTLNKLLVSEKQALGESVRMVCTFCGKFLILCAHEYVTKYFLYFAIFNIFCALILLIIMFRRRIIYRNPIPL